MPIIEELFAFISEEAPGEEGICAFMAATGWMPMVAADKDAVESLRPIAAELASISGRPVRLVRFSLREEIERFERPSDA